MQEYADPIQGDGKDKVPEILDTNRQIAEYLYHSDEYSIQQGVKLRFKLQVSA